jgi:hypothetical protein
MTDLPDFEIGDLVRVRQTISLVPLDSRAPGEIPAGIFGEVIFISVGREGEPVYMVEFHEPYELFSELPLMGQDLELMFRLAF